MSAAQEADETEKNKSLYCGHKEGYNKQALRSNNYQDERRQAKNRERERCGREHKETRGRRST